MKVDGKYYRLKKKKKFFSSKFECSTNLVPFFIISQHRASSPFISLQIESEELVSTSRKLDDDIKSGPDGIPPFFCKRCLASLARPLWHLFNKSLSSGLFPQQ